MATLRDVIQGAYGHLALLQLGQELDADRAAVGLTALNDMLASWAAHGIGTPSQTALLLNDEFPFDARHTQAAKALLAVQLSAASGVDVPVSVDREAQRGWAALLAEYGTAPEARTDPGLTWLGRHRH